MNKNVLAAPKPSVEKKSRSIRFYRTFVSVNTTLVFLFIFIILFFVGTVFPQSSEPDRLQQYKEAGGKFVAVVGALNLLNMFHSSYFFLLSGLFAVQLLLCSIHRFGIIRRRVKYGLFSREELLEREFSFSVTSTDSETGKDIEKTLNPLGFRRIIYYAENAQVIRLIADKGLPYRWFSWGYHLCIFFAIIGFCVTSLFAFEGYVSVAEGEKNAVDLKSSETNWAKLAKLMGRSSNTSKIMEISLQNFITEYNEKPRLEYPERASERFSSILSTGSKQPRYGLPKDSVVPRDWFSAITLYADSIPVKEKKIQVNDPLRYRGMTFYQIGYKQSFDLQVADETLTNLQAQEPFTIPQMEGQFLLETPRAGLVHIYGGGTKLIPPSAKLKYRPPAPQNDRKWTEVAVLAPGAPVEAMHARMTLSNLKESSVLSYRFDPGVPILWISTIVLMALMAMRIYLPWYRIYCHADTTGGRTIITISIRMMGLFAQPARIKSRLSDAFLQ